MAEVSKTPQPAVAKTVEYVGEYRILNDLASPIAKIGNTYKPKDEAEIALLEYQVKMGRVTKVTS